MHPRYFIGLTLPDNLSEQIETIRKPLHEKAGVMKPLLPHITLLHPGTLTSVSPMYLIPKIKSISSKFFPITIKLTRTGMFDERVLYIEVESAEIMLLHKQLTDLLPEHVRSSYEFGKTFVPHITIAQANPRQVLPEELISKLHTNIASLLPYEFYSKNISIFKQDKPRVYSVDNL